MEKVRLELTSFEVSKLLVERSKNIKGGEFEIAIKQGRQINEKSKSIFRILFLATITGKNKTAKNKLIIKVEAYGYFKIFGIPTEEVYNNFIYISAPSIVYPYLRAFVSNITALIGMNTIILDTINFAGITLDKDKSGKRPATKTLAKGSK